MLGQAVTYHYFTDTLRRAVTGHRGGRRRGARSSNLTRVNPGAMQITPVVSMWPMTATPEVEIHPRRRGHHPQPGNRSRRRAGVLDRSRGRAAHRGRTARGAEGMGGTRRQGPRQSARPLRRLARRAPRRDRVAADQGDGQVVRRRGAGSAAADHDPVVLHQDDGEGAGTRNPSGVAAVPGDQEDHCALPAARGGRHHRAVELPGGQRS